VGTTSKLLVLAIPGNRSCTGLVSTGICFALRAGGRSYTCSALPVGGFVKKVALSANASFQDKTKTHSGKISYAPLI
jgi:hypothetical protein